jgi:hypothetical protein
VLRGIWGISRIAIFVVVVWTAVGLPGVADANSPSISFQTPSVAKFTAMITYTVNRGPKTIVSRTCSLSGPTPSSACGSPSPSQHPSSSTDSSTTYTDTFTNLGAGTYSYKVVVKLEDGTSASATIPFNVQKVPPTCTVSAYSVKYDANAHTASGSCTGVGGVPLSGLNLSGTTHTNVGTHTDTWTFTDSSGNYSNATGSVVDVIGKADPTCQVNGYNVPFDSKSHTATGSCTGVAGESLAGLDLSGTTHTNPGVYTDTWTFTDATGNYTTASGTVSDTITDHADHLSVIGPRATTAGTSFSVTVTALDAANQPVPTYTGTIHFTSTDNSPSASLPADYTFTGADQGVHTFTVKLTTAGTQTVTASDTATSSISGTETTTVDPAAPANLSLSGASSSATAGAAQTLTVTAEDAYGNVATSYNGTVHFTSTDSGAGTVLPVDYTFTAADNGGHTFSFTLTTAGSQTVTATDTQDSALTGSETFTVAADTVSITNPGNQDSTVGDAVNLQIHATDAGGSTLTYTATGLPPGLSINSSSGLISGTLTTSGTYTVTLTASAETASDSTSLTWVVANICASPGQKLANPGFELGNTGWTADPAVIGQNGAFGEPPHSGSWDAWLDGNGFAETEILSQTVTIPSGCTNYRFSFWLHIDTAETSTTTAFDTLTVTAGTTTLATFSNLNATLGYVQHSYDLSAFAGQTVTLQFTGTEDSSNQTSFVIDDTALNVS